MDVRILKDRQIFITTMFALAVTLAFVVVAIEIPTMPKAYAAHIEPGCDPGHHMDSDTGKCVENFP